MKEPSQSEVSSQADQRPHLRSSRQLPPRLHAFAARAAFLGAFVVALTVVVWHHDGPVRLDRSLLDGYVPNRSSLLYRVSRVFTELGSPAAVIAMALFAAAVIWTRRRSWMHAAVCVVAPAAAGITEMSAKLIVARPRPVTASLTGEGGMGFPSGHATGFAALAFILALVVPRNRRSRVGALVGALVLSALMAASRVVVGAHYPTDVIAGMILGGVIADATWLAARLVLSDRTGQNNRHRTADRTYGGIA